MELIKFGDLNRFFSKIKKTKKCWGWTGTKHQFGYGSFSFKSKKINAHRFSYIVHCGPIPNGMCVLHKCDIPECVNPDHLFLGTQKDNMEDMASKGRKGKNQNDGKTHCIEGHSLSGDNLRIFKGKRSCKKCNAKAARKYRRRLN